MYVMQERFQWYCNKILPLVYDNSLSYYEVLCKLGDYIKDISSALLALQDQVNNIDDISSEWSKFQEEVNETLSQYETNNQAFQQTVQETLDQYKNTYRGDYQSFITTVRNEMQTMQDTLDAIKDGAYIDLYLDSIKKYIDNNLQKLVAGIVNYVSFGLDNNGHFVAYIPDTWDFIQFGTITDPDSPLYMHLTLQW